MNPQIIIAIVGLAGTLGTLLGTLGAVVLTNRYAAQREEQQWKRQVGEERRRERLEACEAFATTALLVASGTATDDAISGSLTRVQLRGPPGTAQAAMELFAACTDMANTPIGEDVEELGKKIRQKREAFLSVAREEAVRPD